MNIMYFSTAKLPSQFANSVQVMKMCSECGKKNEVTLVGISGDIKTDNLYNFYNVSSSFAIELLPKNAGLVTRLRYLFNNIKKYDVIYTRYILAAVISSYLFNKKTVFEYHSISESRLNVFFERLLSNSKNAYHVFITKALEGAYKNRFKSLCSAKTIVLPDGADVVNIESDNTKPIINSCGFIGSFQKGKGVDLVIDIAKKLPNVSFHIVGGKKEEIEAYKKTSSNNIIWHGFLNQNEAMYVLNNEIDIALLPNSRKVFVGKNQTSDIGKYTSPMKLFEYMAYGKPIIASNLQVLKEVVQDGYNALLADPDDASTWVSAITRLLNDRNLCVTISCNAHNDLVNKYSWESRCKKLYDFLQ